MPRDYSEPERMAALPDGPGALRVSSLYAAMRRSRYATREDRERAARVDAAFPGTSALVRAAGGFHSRAARRAVTEGGCEGALLAGGGFPVPRPWHEEAAAAAPLARFGYAVLHPVPAALCAVTYAPQVACWRGSARDPAALLGAAAALGSPLQVHLHMLLHHWTAQACQRLIGEYARLLPAGSSLALSAWLLGDGMEGALLAALIAAAGWPVHRHAEGDLRKWIAAAGLALDGEGVTDVRQHGRRGWQPRRRTRTEGLVVGAVAVKPRRGAGS